MHAVAPGIAQLVPAPLMWDRKASWLTQHRSRQKRVRCARKQVKAEKLSSTLANLALHDPNLRDFYTSSSKHSGVLEHSCVTMLLRNTASIKPLHNTCGLFGNPNGFKCGPIDKISSWLVICLPDAFPLEQARY